MMEDALEDEVCEYSLIQDYDFEYEDEEDEDADALMENKYYNAKGTFRDLIQKSRALIRRRPSPNFRTLSMRMNQRPNGMS